MENEYCNGIGFRYRRKTKCTANDQFLSSASESGLSCGNCGKDKKC